MNLRHTLGLGLVLFLAVGCESTGLVKNLPAPNFNGPEIVKAAPVAPLPVAPQASVQPPRPPITRPQHPEWAPRASAHAWKWIVIHHSASTTGSAAIFDRVHREERGWDELGYHFVIGNGTRTGDGQVEVGSRWPKQKHGAHADTPDNAFNDDGIGICLVGDFNVQQPTRKQLESLTQLVIFLQTTYRIPSNRIISHGSVHDLAKGGTITDCPGRYLNITQVRRMVAQAMADNSEAIEDESPTATADVSSLITTP